MQNQFCHTLYASSFSILESSHFQMKISEVMFYLQAQKKKKNLTEQFNLFVLFMLITATIQSFQDL